MTPLIWAAVLLGIAVFLVVMELVVPSGGLISVVAAAAMVASIVIVGLHYGFRAGLVYFTVAVFAAPIIVASLIHWLPGSPLGEMIMNLPARKHDTSEEQDSPTYRHRELLGKVGRAKTKMLPSGVVEIAGKRYDAVSRGPAIDPGQLIEVVSVDGFRILVQPAREGAQMTRRPSPTKETGAADLTPRPLDEIVPDPFDDSFT